MPPHADWIGSDVIFGKDRVEAPAPLGCGHAEYDTTSLIVDGVFQGTLAASEDAVVQVRELQLDPAATPTLQVSCDTGVFDYHRDDEGRLLIMLDNVIYVLERARRNGDSTHE